MIYYLCPDNNEPFGGIKKIYNHVDTLNRCGLPALVLHGKRAFRCDWFANTTRTAALNDVTITKDDCVAVPEFYNRMYMNPSRRDYPSKVFRKVFATQAKKVIFNQGTYITFSGNSLEKDELVNLHTDPSVIGTMTVSEDGELFLSHAFPNLPIFRIHNAVNTDIFFPGRDKKDQICFMTSKNLDHVVNVINLLKFRGVLAGYHLAPIEGLTESETARVMEESVIFLSFGFPEGFSLPPAEAMACSCIVVGYHGLGGREYFLPELCFPIETGNVLEFARTVERVISSLRINPEPLKKMMSKASSHIRSTYSPAREQEDVLRCWGTLLERTGREGRK